MTQAKILLTGAKGNVGTELVKRLSAMNIPFKAWARTGDAAGFLNSVPHAEIVYGDMAETDKLFAALDGIEKVFLLTNSSEQAEALQIGVVEAARKAGVRHIVKLSQFAAAVDSPVRFLRYHAAVENRIRESGMDYTFLRPNLYMQGLMAFKDYITHEGKFYASVGGVGISAVDIRDIAAVAATVLTREGYENKIYNITGPVSLTHYEMADVFSNVLGRKISFVDVTPDQMEGALRAAGFPEWQVGGLIEDYAHYARGEAAEVFETVKDVTGKEAIPFEQFVREWFVE